MTRLLSLLPDLGRLAERAADALSGQAIGVLGALVQQWLGGQ